MPRNIKDINNILPHERYKMEENDPFETMKKTIHDKGLLNNYDRELAERNKKNNLNKNGSGVNINNENKLNIKPIIVRSDQKKIGNKYDIFNKNKDEINKIKMKSIR